MIYFGGLYTGAAKGLKRTFQSLKNSNARTIIVTVGLADVNKKENTDHIKNSIAKQVDTNILKSSFYLSCKRRHRLRQIKPQT